MFVFLSGTTIFCKVMSLFLRVFLTNNVGVQLLGEYLMILPTIQLCLTITQLGIPSAIFNLSSQQKYNKHSLLKKALYICSVQLIVFICISFLFKNIQPYLSTILLFIIFACISAICRSYLLGKQKAIQASLSQLIEEVTRIVYLLLTFHTKQTITIDYLMDGMLIGEMVSCFYLLWFISKSKIELFENRIVSIKDYLNISIPMSLIQGTHSLSHYLEPFIYTTVLSQLNYTTETINESYGLIQGCVLTILMIPSFFNSVIYRMLLPKMTQALINLKRTQRLIIRSFYICLIIGLPFSIFFYFFPKFSLRLFFGDVTGYSYLHYLAIPFLLHYLQTPFLVYLQATNKQLVILITSIIQSITSLILLYLLLPLYGPFALAVSFLCGLIVHAAVTFIYVYKHLFLNCK